MTQIAIDNRPRLQKLQNVLKIKVIMKTANEEMEEILDEKDLDITELNHFIYAAATVITEEIMEQESINYKHRGQRHPVGWTHTGEHK